MAPNTNGSSLSSKVMQIMMPQRRKCFIKINLIVAKINARWWLTESLNTTSFFFYKRKYLYTYVLIRAYKVCVFEFNYPLFRNFFVTKDASKCATMFGVCLRAFGQLSVFVCKKNNSIAFTT